MDRILGFDLRTKEEKEAEDKQYYHTMFPFGDRQIKWEIDTIANYFKESKIKKENIRFLYLIKRENMISAKKDNSITETRKYKRSIKNLEKLQKLYKFSDEDVRFIDAMAILENNAESLGSLPSVSYIKSQI